MAYIYENTPVLSRIQIGENTYYLKDADVRAILDTFNNTIVTGTLGLVSDNDSSLVTAANIKSYVDSAIAVGLVVEVVQELPTASASTMGKLYLVSQSQGKTDDYYNEYITIRSGQEGSYSYAWELIGDTRIDLSNYLTAVSYDDENHKLQQTKNGQTTDVHEFGALADADTASGSYTPQGTISDITVIDSVGTQASFTQGTDNFTQGSDSFTANVPTALDLTKFSGGSKAADTFSAGTLPSKAADNFSAGTLPSLTVGTGANAETLIFNAGAAPSFTEGAFDAGSLPSFTEGQFTPASLAEGFYSAGSAASFVQGTDSFTQGSDSFTANSVATTKSVTPTFSGTAATITVTPDEE